MAFMDNKGSNKGYNRNDAIYAEIKIQRNTLNQFIKYLLTDNERFIKEAEIRNLSNLLDEIDVESVYEVGEVSLRNKFYFLKELVKIKYDGSIKDTGAIAEHLESVFKHKMSDNDLSENLYIMFNYEEDKKNNEGMRNSEIDSLNEFVRSRIQYIALYKAIDNIEGMNLDLK